MKKCKSLVLVFGVALLAVSSFGCGDSKKTSVDKEIQNVESDSAGDTTESVAESEKVTIKEQVLLDEQDVKITATSLEEDWTGPELNILIENNSDKDLTFQVRNESVNGYMVETTIYEDVPAGKKANSSISFMESDLEEAGITTIGEMEFSFHCIDENWDSVIESEMIRVETSAYGSFEQKIDDSGEVLFEQDGIKIVGKGLSSDSSALGTSLVLYIENNSDKDITVQSRDTSINGFVVDPIMSEDIVVGKRAISSLTFMDSELEDNGITDIKSIETSFHIVEMNKFGDPIVDTDVIKLDF